MSRYVDADNISELLDEKYREMISTKYGEIYDVVIADTLCEVENLINKIPTADFELVVHGKWIAKEDTAYPYLDIYSCSNCGAEPLLTDDPYSDYHNMVLSNFCPNCGAIMDEKQ